MDTALLLILLAIQGIQCAIVGWIFRQLLVMQRELGEITTKLASMEKTLARYV
jgi:hypothetical protein